MDSHIRVTAQQQTTTLRGGNPVILLIHFNTICTSVSQMYSLFPPVSWMGALKFTERRSEESSSEASGRCRETEQKRITN